LQHYVRSVERLDALDWVLDHPLDLARWVEVMSFEEARRVAYPAQLRSEHEDFHYYGVLSHDRTLDRVNAVFCRYLLAYNAQAIEAGGFWWPQPPAPLRQPSLKAGFIEPAPGDALTALALPGVVGGGLLRLVPGPMLSERTKDRMARLLFATSYLEYCSFANKLGLDLVSLQRRQNIDPYLRFSQGLALDDDTFLGFFTAGPMVDFQSCAATSYYRDEVHALDEAYESFLQAHSRPSDYFVCSLALEERFRGRGLFHQMLQHIEGLARQAHCPRIVLTVWESGDAFQIYLKKGFRVCASFDYAFKLFFDRLHFLEFRLDAPMQATALHGFRPRNRLAERCSA